MRLTAENARERPEVVAFLMVRAAMLGDLRRRVIAGEKNIGKGFVVAHQDVEARLHLLDVIGLEQQRLGLGLGRDEDHGGGQRDHPGDAIGVAERARIACNAAAHAFRLADVENLAIGRDHAIDAGSERRVAPEAADDGGALTHRSGRGLVVAEIETGQIEGFGVAGGLIVQFGGGREIGVRRADGA